jgi:hypothetical protein
VILYTLLTRGVDIKIINSTADSLRDLSISNQEVPKDFEEHDSLQEHVSPSTSRQVALSKLNYKTTNFTSFRRLLHSNSSPSVSAVTLPLGIHKLSKDLHILLFDYLTPVSAICLSLTIIRRFELSALS